MRAFVANINSGTSSVVCALGLIQYDNFFIADPENPQNCPCPAVWEANAAPGGILLRQSKVSIKTFGWLSCVAVNSQAVLVKDSYQQGDLCS